MNQEILKFCMGKGVLLDKETLSFLSDFDVNTAKDLIDRISGLRERVITKSFFINNVDKIRELIHDEKVIEKIKINLGLTVEISRERILKKSNESVPGGTGLGLGHLKIIDSYKEVAKKIEPGNFIRYFKNRYVGMRKIFLERSDLENLTSINKINGQKQNLSLIGMVYDKRITKNKNIILEVEDLTGKINVLINKMKEGLYEKASNVLIDDIIGIKGMGNREIIFVNDLIYPDAFLQEKKNLEREEYAAFTSDVHVGSLNFLEKKFLKFIKWLNGEVGDERQREEAKKIKYLFITGDSVDGVGVFPGQEEFLNIKDIKQQYEKLAEYLGSIRKDVKIIMCPGQHDAVRVAEPQPAIGENYASKLHELDNLFLVSNPAVVEIGNDKKRGLRILMYHGASMHPYVIELEHLRLERAHDSPSKVVRELLKRRHLASMHSHAIYVPDENKDRLLIEEVPDIIATADFHRSDVDLYNNILIICSSCWQSQTSFEEKVGNNPDPCRVPVINLKTRAIKIWDFS